MWISFFKLVIAIVVASADATGPELVESNSSYHMYIVPKNSFNCTVSKACFTLQQLADRFLNYSSEYLEMNITLIIEPGRHYLDGGVELNSTASVVITGQQDNGNKPEISCKEKSCFSFRNTSTIIIESLTFSECFSEDSDGGAIFVSEAEAVSIRQCSFVNNFIRKRGGAMRLQLIESLAIVESQFLNNSAMCHPSNFIFTYGNVVCSEACTASSGAISAFNISSIAITDSVFDGNVASCYSGCVSVAESNITVVNTKFTRNSISASPGSGGSLTLYSCTVQISDCLFQGNHVNGGINNGGGIHSSSSTLDIMQSYFVQNTAGFLGGAAFFSETALSIDMSLFSKNEAILGGGGIAIHHPEFTNISNSIFQNNSLPTRSGGIGGAVYLILKGKANCTDLCIDNKLVPTHYKPAVLITSCTFKSNTGDLNGGAIFALKGMLEVSNCKFIQNTAFFGGAIHSSESITFLLENIFISNTAFIATGGAVYLSDGILYGVNNTYLNNNGPSGGGAISAITSTVFSQADRYTGNRAKGRGGAISALFGNIVCSQCSFTDNSALTDGGAVNVWHGSYTSNDSSYEANYASQNGGALFLLISEASINGNYFFNNTADFGEGSAIFQTDDSIQLFNTAFIQNKQYYKGSHVYTIQLTSVRGNCHNLTFRGNIGSINIFSSILDFSGSLYLTENIGTAGGAFTIIQSTASFGSNSEVIISNNSATYGGGVFLSHSELRVYTSSFRIGNNTATVSGGGVYGYQSQMRIDTNATSNSETVLFARNVAGQNGGAMITIATVLNIFHGSILFTNNKAMRGGGGFLSEGSKIYIQKTSQELINKLNIKLVFSNNSAEYGGALYVADETNSATLCQQSATSSVRQISNEECFIQTIRLYYPQNFTFNQFNYMNIFFRSNYGIFGNDIFGGLLDRCQINAFSEIRNFAYTYNYIGFDYLKTIAHFQVNVNYSQLTQPFNPILIIHTISNNDFKGLISSTAVQLCFCINNTYRCSYQWPRIFAKRGEPFLVRALTVNQVRNPVKGTVLASITSDTSRLKNAQRQQGTNGVCTELVYNIFSTETNTTLKLYPDGPCKDIGISSKSLNVTFLPCDCPNGLQPVSSDNECKCECDSSLESSLRSCQIDNRSITVVRGNNDIWIQYAYNENMTGFLLHNCPHDYCVENPVNLSMSLPLNVDKQCAYNRTGIMCGECKEGLSLVFGSSRCVQCNNNYLALLIAFAFAGIALVAFILILNMTVAVGTIHGLILYANIVGANSPVFLPPTTALGFFVSWVNLDLGIETCFFDGMNSSTKVWLQLVFPSYIIILSILIIILSTFWARFARLIGRRNPVATLCTLFLLSYSKLLRTVIAILQFLHLTFPDGSNKILWMYNPNISYFTQHRIPFFITVIVITLFGTIYTTLLLFDQCLRKVKKLGRCTQSNKYNAFIDAYHAPFVFKHCYWIGILLLTRIVHHCLSAVLNESTHLLIVSSLMCALLTLKLLTREMYKNWSIGFLETSYFINLLLFSLSSFYLSSTNQNSDQVVLGNTSVAIALITFSGIILYHIHKYCLKSLNSYSKVIAVLKSTKISRRDILVSKENELVPESSTLRMNLLREPDLDDLAPILPQDYDHVAIAPARDSVASHPVTSTTVSIDGE